MRRLYYGQWRVDLDLREHARAMLTAAGLRGRQLGVARTVVATLERVGAPSPASIGLILTDDADIAELNATHMGESGPTDVLSFPLLPPGAFPAHESDADRSAAAPTPFALPPRTRPHLGDIVVSVERAMAQAAGGLGGQTGDVQWSAGDEIRLLAVHGALHVCGWDHAEPAEETAMRELEREILG